MPLFYDPHPGLMGCDIPVPDNVLSLIQKIDGKKADISDVIKTIKRTAGKGFRVEISGDMIVMRDGSVSDMLDKKNTKPIHSWRLLRFK